MQINTVFIIMGVAVFLVLFIKFGLGFVAIGESEIGIVVKRFGKTLPEGKLIALNGEAGFQVDPLTTGWKFGYWSWMYKVEKVPVIKIEQGKMALIVAEDGESLPNSQILGKVISCNDFQDARSFLTNGGQKGKQAHFLKTGIYKINTALFSVITEENCQDYGLTRENLMTLSIPSDHVGLVTVRDGQSLQTGKVASSSNLIDHDSFQNPEKFLKNNGYKGLQVEVLPAGSYNINPWFATVDIVQISEIPLAHVGVVISSAGEDETDVSGEQFTHGNLVKQGGRGIWNDPLLPGKRALNTKITTVQLVPTSNTVLNWADSETASHKLDENLSSIKVRSRDGFSFSLDVSQIIHVAAQDAAKVISRVGSMKNLIENVLEPIIGSYFRNAAQDRDMLDFITQRKEIQKNASNHITDALKQYNVIGVETLIGDLTPPEQLMKTLTDRKVAMEQKKTYETQEETEKQRQKYLKESSLAEEQKRLVGAEQSVFVAKSNATSTIEAMKGEAESLKLKAEAEASVIRTKADAEAESIQKVGKAKADAYKQQAEALGAELFTNMEMIKQLSEHNVKLTPEILVMGNSDGNSSGSSGLLNVLLAKHLTKEDKVVEVKSEPVPAKK